MTRRALVRWYRDRCAHCGHRFALRGDARFASGNRDGKVYHRSCQAYLIWRAKADHRLAALGLVCEVWKVDYSDLQILVGIRAETDDERVTQGNRLFQVFHDLKKLRSDATTHPTKDPS